MRVHIGLFVVVATASCASAPPKHAAAHGAEPPRYSLVFFIHGDGDYTFHDADGDAHKADEAILASARTVAERNPNAEVFLFHETRRRKLLFVVPRKDGHAYYYRNGELVEERSYWRDQGASRFDPEMTIYEELSATRLQPAAKMFFYFGHEIPEFDGDGYDRSYPKRSFTVPDLTAGLKRMAGNSAKFDVVVLGTCYGGTPYTVNAIAPYARYVVASPENLHRSYFDLRPLEGLDGDWDASAFATEFARNAYERLDEEIETAISVVVYDVDRTISYLNTVEEAYAETLSSLDARSRERTAHCDCAEDPAYVHAGIDDGVEVLYRAPRFGRSKGKQGHSGWGCWKTN